MKVAKPCCSTCYHYEINDNGLCRKQEKYTDNWFVCNDYSLFEPLETEIPLEQMLEALKEAEEIITGEWNRCYGKIPDAIKAAEAVLNEK